LPRVTAVKHAADTRAGPRDEMDVDVTDARAILDLAREVDRRIVDHDAGIWIKRSNERVARIGAAARLLLEESDADAALDLVGALSIFWQEVGRVDEGRKITEEVLDRVRGHPRTRAMGRAYLALGELAFRQGDQPAATAATNTSKAIAAELNDDWVAGRSEMNLARIAFRDGDAPRTLDHAARLLDMAGPNLRLRTGAIHMLGWAEYTAGNVSGAIARFEENARLYREVGNSTGEAGELANLADLAMESAQWDAAAAYLRQAFSVPGALESQYLVPGLIRSAGVLAGLRAEHERALCLISWAEHQYEKYGLIGDPGDTLTPRVRAEAVRVLGEERANDVTARARALSLEHAVKFSTTNELW
jgi:tetratricopeptide (TPR) repeat protein